VHARGCPGVVVAQARDAREAGLVIRAAVPW
jgi:hypothetical protein